MIKLVHTAFHGEDHHIIYLSGTVQKEAIPSLPGCACHLLCSSGLNLQLICCMHNGEHLS